MLVSKKTFFDNVDLVEEHVKWVNVKKLCICVQNVYF